MPKWNNLGVRRPPPLRPDLAGRRRGVGWRARAPPGAAFGAFSRAEAQSPAERPGRTARRGGCRFHQRRHADIAEQVLELGAIPHRVRQPFRQPSDCLGQWARWPGWCGPAVWCDDAAGVAPIADPAGDPGEALVDAANAVDGPSDQPRTELLPAAAPPGPAPPTRTGSPNTRWGCGVGRAWRIVSLNDACGQVEVTSGCSGWWRSSQVPKIPSLGPTPPPTPSHTGRGKHEADPERFLPPIVGGAGGGVAAPRSSLWAVGTSRAWSGSRLRLRVHTRQSER